MCWICDAAAERCAHVAFPDHWKYETLHHLDRVELHDLLYSSNSSTDLEGVSDDEIFNGPVNECNTEARFSQHRSVSIGANMSLSGVHRSMACGMSYACPIRASRACGAR